MAFPSPTPNPSSTTTTTTIATPSSFAFPREYYFPPFFTRQTNLTTHHAQLVKWSALVLSYCRHHRIFKLSISASGISSSITTNSQQQPQPQASSPPSPTHGSSQQQDSGSSTTNDPSELFHNRKLNRRLSLSDIREVIEFLRRDGRAEYIYKGSGSSSNNNTNGDFMNGFDSGGGVGADGKGGGGAGGGDVVWIFWRTPEEWASLIEVWVDETAQKGSVLTLYELTNGEGTRGTEFHGLDPELLQKALATLVKRGKAQIFGQEDSKGVKFF